jgi:hypothetical protein
MTEQKFKKGDEVWFVRVSTAYGYTPIDQPEIWHGRIVGGGDTRATIEWDHRPRDFDRRSWYSLASTYFATREEAITNGLDRLEGLRRAALHHAELASAGLAFLERHQKVEKRWETADPDVPASGSE